MEDKTFSSLEQELAENAGKLDAQSLGREKRMVEITLDQIAGRVRTCQDEIVRLMTGSQSKNQNAVREVVVSEVRLAANDLLWCREYVERLRSDQRVSIYTGSHWEEVKPQQWKDFVGLCAEKCGVPPSQLGTPPFMNLLYESVAFNLSQYRRQHVPDGEMWLNMRNGTLVVRADGTILLRDHQKEDLFTYTLPYCYDAHATCELWQRFLDRVLPETESQKVLAEFVGYCMHKPHSMEKMLMLYGNGQNGKSVTLEVIESLLGSQNVSYLSLSDLTNDVVKRSAIEGKMVNISHESGKDVNANVLKQLTSGERVLIKYLYRNPYETSNYGKLIAAFNQLPRAENTLGFFRRLIILPFSVTITEEEKDVELSRKLRQELSGILNWVLAALPDLMCRKRFTHSSVCQRALEQYALQSDNVRLFLNEMCEEADIETPVRELYAAYCDYCRDLSLRYLGRNKFIARLESLGNKPVVYNKVKYFNLKINQL